MYIKKSNLAIFLGLSALVGFGLSFMFGNVQGPLLSGDISKATRYNNQKEDPEVSVIEEKLKSDEEFCNSTKSAVALLKSRVDGLSSLTERTIAECSGIPEFEGVMKGVVSLNAKACNTNAALENVSKGIEALADGKNAPGYEQNSNNAFVGFQKIERQVALGKTFVETAASWLDGKEGEKAEAIAKLVAEWSVYCAEDAYLNNSAEDLAYWGEKYGEFTSEANSVLANGYKEICNTAPMVNNASPMMNNADQMISNASPLVGNASPLVSDSEKIGISDKLLGIASKQLVSNCGRLIGNMDPQIISCCDNLMSNTGGGKWDEPLKQAGELMCNTDPGLSISDKLIGSTDKGIVSNTDKGRN